MERRGPFRKAKKFDFNDFRKKTKSPKLVYEYLKKNKFNLYPNLDFWLSQRLKSNNYFSGYQLENYLEELNYNFFKIDEINSKFQKLPRGFRNYIGLNDRSIKIKRSLAEGLGGLASNEFIDDEIVEYKYYRSFFEISTDLIDLFKYGYYEKPILINILEKNHIFVGVYNCKNRILIGLNTGINRLNLENLFKKISDEFNIHAFLFPTRYSIQEYDGERKENHFELQKIDENEGNCRHWRFVIILEFIRFGLYDKFLKLNLNNSFLDSAEGISYIRERDRQFVSFFMQMENFYAYLNTFDKDRYLQVISKYLLHCDIETSFYRI